MILTDQVVIEDRKEERKVQTIQMPPSTFHVSSVDVEGQRVSVRLRLVNMIALFHGMMTDI